MAFVGRIFDPFDILDPLQGWVSDFEFACADQSQSNNINRKETPGINGGLPGRKEEDVKVEAEQGRVVEWNKEEDDDKRHGIVRGLGRFFRRFRRPESLKMDQTEADHAQGGESK